MACCCLQKVEGLVETSPGVRSCMIEYDQRVLPLTSLLKTLLDAEQQLPDVSAICCLKRAQATLLHGCHYSLSL